MAVSLLLNLSTLATFLGLGGLVLGLVYLTVLTRGFRRPPPELEDSPTEPTADRGRGRAGSLII